MPQLDAWLVARDVGVREVLRRPAGDFSPANAIRPDVPSAAAVHAELATDVGGRLAGGDLPALLSAGMVVPIAQ